MHEYLLELIKYAKILNIIAQQVLGYSYMKTEAM